MDTDDTTINLLRDLIAAGNKALEARLGIQDKMLERILSEQKRTNGRVTALEQRAAVTEGEQSARQGVREHRRWRLSLVASCTVVLIAAVLGALFAGRF